MLRDSALILCILLPASLEDLRHLRVSNEIIIYGLCISLLFRLDSGGIYAIPKFLEGLAFPFLFGFILYKFGALGASDVKLFSVICSNYSISEGFVIITLSFFFGALFSVCSMVHYHTMWTRLTYFTHYVSQVMKERRLIKYFESNTNSEGSVVPFAVCISLGTVIAMLLN